MQFPSAALPADVALPRAASAADRQAAGALAAGRPDPGRSFSRLYPDLAPRSGRAPAARRAGTGTDATPHAAVSSGPVDAPPARAPRHAHGAHSLKAGAAGNPPGDAVPTPAPAAIDPAALPGPPDAAPLSAAAGAMPSGTTALSDDAFAAGDPAAADAGEGSSAGLPPGGPASPAIVAAPAAASPLASSAVPLPAGAVPPAKPDGKTADGPVVRAPGPAATDGPAPPPGRATAPIAPADPAGPDKPAAANLPPPASDAASGLGNPPPSAAGAKIAAASPPSPDGRRMGVSDAKKNVLVAEDKSITDDNEAIGIGAARGPTAMPAAQLLHSPANASSEHGGLAPSGPAVPPETAAARAPAPAESTSGVAQRAVEAVLTAAERSQSAGQHSVNLQFSLSGVDLAVRVQLRSGAVHATFRTDSPELRSALAEEWHSVSAQSAGAPLRMVAPVFTSKEAMSSGHFQGGGGSPGRETGGRRPAAAPSFAVPAASAKPAAALSSPVSAAPGRAAARLHVLA